MASVEGFLASHDVPAVKPVVNGAALLLVGYRRRSLRQIGGGCHGLDPRQGQRPAGVDSFDSGVGMGAAQQLAVQQSGRVNIGGIASPAQHFVWAVMADWTGAHHIVVPG